MIILLYGLIICGCTYIGFGLSQYYDKRVKIFFELTQFCEKLKTDITFLLMPLGEILKNARAEYNSPLMEEMLNICKNMLKEGKPLNRDELNSSLNCKYISEEEKRIICGFFSMLGKTDEKTQIENIDNFYRRFTALEILCQNDKKKFCPMFKKLGFLSGLTICLFML